MHSPLPALVPITYVIGAVLIVLARIFSKNKGFINALFLLFNLFGFSLTFIVFKQIVLDNVGYMVYGFGGWIPPLGVVYIVDSYSSILALTTTLLGLLIAFYSIEYFNESNGVEYLYVIVLILVSALTAIYYTGDLFNTFVMVELMAVAAYSLVAFEKHKGLAVEASLKYGLVAGFAGILFFISLGFIYAYTGTLSMPDLAAKTLGLKTFMEKYSGVLMSGLTPILVVIGLMYWSLLLESAVFPLHFWLPDAHSEAPSPVSALLSGLVVNAGLYIILRSSYTVFNSTNLVIPSYELLLTLLVFIGCIGSLYASVMMLVQNDVKRLIAYSTVMHVSLMTMIIGLNNVSASRAVLYHFITHSLSKTLAFLSVGVLIVATGSRSIGDLKGLSRMYPVTSAALIISLLGLAGVPPLGTFPSKLLMVKACIDAGNPYTVIVIVLSSTLAAIAYFKLIYTLINEPQVKTTRYKPGILMKTTLIIIAVLVILVGVLLPLIYPYIDSSANQLIDSRRYIESVTQLYNLFSK